MQQNHILTDPIQNLTGGEWSSQGDKLNYDGRIDVETCEKGKKSRQMYFKESCRVYKKSHRLDLDLPSPSKVTVPNVVLPNKKTESRTERIFRYNQLVCDNQIEGEVASRRQIAILEEKIEQKRCELEGFEKRELQRVTDELNVMTVKLDSMKIQLEKSTNALKICNLLEERVKHLKTSSETGTKTELCLLCQSNPANMVLVPCGHNFLCHDCVEPFKIEMSFCGICRETYSLTQRIYR